MTKRILAYVDLLGLGITYSRTHLARLEAAGQFPRRFMISSRRSCWDEDQTMAWLNSKRTASAATTWVRH